MLDGAKFYHLTIFINRHYDKRAASVFGEHYRLAIQIHNLKHPDAPRAQLSEDAVELLTTPMELATFKSAVTEAMFKGTRREVESEEEQGSKNTPTG